MPTVPPQVELSVLVPLHNEEANVVPLHELLSDTLGPLELSYELLFVNDGSDDSTAKELQRLAEQDEHLVVLEHAGRRGKAVAIETALERSCGSLLLITDGDLQYDPADIPLLLESLRDGCDVVSGCRADRDDPFPRRLGSRAYNSLVNGLSGTHFSDHFSGIKGFRAEALKNMRLEGGLVRFPLVVAAHRGLVVREVSVRHQARASGASSYSLLRLTRLAWTDLRALLPFLLHSR
jgi:glycosyltransferase involved in cell wall biosynthesis